jgi:hypothetical protein
MVEPMNPSSQRRLVRWGGAAAVAGGVYSLVIATIYAVTRVGARGDRLFGSLDPLLFPAPALFTLSLVIFRVRYGKDVAQIGRLGLALAILGMILVTFGQFGFSFLGFTRSGNYSIGPGMLCVELGLLVFAVSAARGHKLPRRMWVLPFLMTVLPVLVIAASQVVALLQGSRLLSIDDIYFQGLYVAWAVLWIVLGVLLWFEGKLSHDLVAKVCSETSL